MKKLAPVLFSCVVLASCGAPTQNAAAYREMTTTSLWMEHQTTNPMSLALIEAELGRRGETSFGSDYLGKQTRSAYGKSLYSRSAAVTDLKNCSDFSSAASAQQYFLANGGPLRDPSGLDRDGDGLACEWGTKLRQISSSFVAKQRARTSTYRPRSSRRSYSSGCYVGPRGGTYTITSSGRKNYGGC